MSAPGAGPLGPLGVLPPRTLVRISFPRHFTGSFQLDYYLTSERNWHPQIAETSKPALSLSLLWNSEIPQTSP